MRFARLAALATLSLLLLAAPLASEAQILQQARSGRMLYASA
jgi:hypothetical protein